MDFAVAVQETMRVMVHAPSGKPKVLTTVIRQSIALGILTLRAMRPCKNIDEMTAMVFFAGWALVSWQLAAHLLALTGLGPVALDPTAHALLQSIYTLGIASTALPFYRDLRQKEALRKILRQRAKIA